MTLWDLTSLKKETTPSIIISIDSGTHIGKKLWSHLAITAHTIPATWKHIDDYSKSENFSANVGNHIFNLFDPKADTPQKIEIINKIVKRILNSKEVLNNIINRNEWPAVEPKNVEKFKWSSIRKIVGSTEAIWPVIENYCQSNDFFEAQGLRIINFFYRKVHTENEKRIMKFVIKSTFWCEEITKELIQPDWPLLGAIHDFPNPTKRYAIKALYPNESLPKIGIYKTIKSFIDQKNIEQASNILIKTKTKRLDLWIMVFRAALESLNIVFENESNTENLCESENTIVTSDKETDTENLCESENTIVTSDKDDSNILQQVIQFLCEIPFEHNWEPTEIDAKKSITKLILKEKKSITKLILKAKTQPEILCIQISEQKSFWPTLFPIDPPSDSSKKIYNKIWPHLILTLKHKNETNKSKSLEKNTKIDTNPKIAKWTNKLHILDKKNLWITLFTLAQDEKSIESNPIFFKNLSLHLFDNFLDAINNIPFSELTTNQIKCVSNIKSKFENNKNKIFIQIYSYITLVHHHKNDYTRDLLPTLKEVLNEQFLPTVQSTLNYFYHNPKHWDDDSKAQKMFLDLIDAMNNVSLDGTTPTPLLPQELQGYENNTLISLIGILEKGNILNYQNLSILIKTAQIPDSIGSESKQVYETLAQRFLKLKLAFMTDLQVIQYIKLLKNCSQETKIKAAESLLTEGLAINAELLWLVLPSFCLELEKKRSSIKFTPTVKNNFFNSIKNLPQHPVGESELLIIQTLLQCDQDVAIIASIHRANLFLKSHSPDNKNLTSNLCEKKSLMISMIGQSIAKRPLNSQTKLFEAIQEVLQNRSLADYISFAEGFKNSKNVNALISILSNLIKLLKATEPSVSQIDQINNFIAVIFLHSEKFNKNDRISLIKIWKSIINDKPNIPEFPSKLIQKIFVIKTLESAFKDLDMNEIPKILKILRPTILTLQIKEFLSENQMLTEDDIALFYATMAISNFSENITLVLNGETQNRTIMHQTLWPIFNVIQKTVKKLIDIPKIHDENLKLKSKVESFLYILANESLKNQNLFGSEHQSFELYIKRFHQENPANHLSQYDLVEKGLRIQYNQENVHLLYYYLSLSIIQLIKNPGTTPSNKILKQIMGYVEICLELPIKNFKNNDALKSCILTSIQTIVLQLTQSTNLIKSITEYTEVSKVMFSWIERIKNKYSETNSPINLN